MAEELGGLPEEAIEDLDEMDLTVVRFNKNYALRGKSGRYLTANSTQDTANSAANTPRGALPRSIFQQNPITYTLGVNGQGIGEDLDCLNFVNLDSR